MKEFFATGEQLPQNSGWHMYDIHHGLWLLGIAAMISVACWYYRHLDTDKRKLFLKGLAVLIVIQEIMKDVIHLITGSFVLEHLPFHLCGLSIFICLAYAYRPGKIKKEMIYSLCMPGAMAALIFPDWTNCPLWNFMNVNSFTIHGWLVMFCFVLLFSGELKPDFRNLSKCFLFLLAIAPPLYLFNKCFGTNFMFLNVPAPGSPLEILAALLGNPGYILGAIGLILVVWALLYIPWEVGYRLEKKKESV